MVAADRPAALVLLASRLLADEDAGWGHAMVGELTHVDGRSARWRFAVGCVRAALFAPVRRPGFAAGVTVLGVADLSLVAGALVRFPGLRSGAGVWFAVAAFLVVLTGYALTAVTLGRRTSGQPAMGMAAALGGGVVVAALWTSLAVVTSQGIDGVAGPVMLIGFPVTCLAIGAIGTRHGGPAAGTLGVLLAGVVAGLVTFLTWTADSVLRDGRPYDAGLVRDFHASGAHDLATYAVNDSLGSAMMLLLVVPLATVVLGLAGQVVVLALRRRP